VPTARASRTIAAPLQELWDLICDPHHLPRWWPRVTRVEEVTADAFTQVMKTKKGKIVRADFDVVGVDEAAHLLTWSQRVQGTPFENVLRSAETELRLSSARADAKSADAAKAFGELGGPGEPGEGDGPGASSLDTAATEVTIELRQEMARSTRTRGYLSMSPRFGTRLMRRAAESTLAEALDGLERISG